METSDLLLRLGAALAAGTLLGLERESRGRAAGLRTTILVCMASTAAMILSDVIYAKSTAASLDTGSAGGWRPDPARLAAGILTGIGFLGGGVILRQGNIIRGVTTAALIWYVTVLGLCFGNGQFLLGFIGLGVGLVVLFVLPRVEDYVQSDWYAKLIVTWSGSDLAVKDIVQTVEAAHVHVKSLDLTHDLVQGSCSATLHLKFKRDDLIEKPETVVTAIMAKNGMLKAEWVC